MVEVRHMLGCRCVSRAVVVIIALLATVLVGCKPTATATLPPATRVLGPDAPTVTVQLPQPPTATVQAAATPEGGEARPASAFTLTILHTNDVNGWLDPCG
jgi:2',3'-cyclic-nucleotide 2'-phosphodiesterase (5'-nucleotidase family)